MKQNERFSSIEEFEILPVPTNSKNCLGVGSFGSVKLAKHKHSLIKYALKIVNLKELECEAEVQSIRREIRVHSKLDHPYIIKFYDSFQKGNIMTMVLEYAENGSLYTCLRKRKRFSESEAFVFFYQTLKAIEFLHENDILHRDIKPENLLLDKNYNIKLCDFGWCTEDIKKKRTTFCGTYEYMSPEVVFKRPYNTNIDIWSLGILLYELTTGGSPFRAKNLQEITQKFKNHKELYFPDYLSADLKHLISGILKMDSEQRFTIKHILASKWLKKMYISTGYEENHSLNKNGNRLEKPHSTFESKLILKDSKNLKISEVNDFSDKRFLFSPKVSIDLSITKVRRPLFYDNNKKNEVNLNLMGENSAYYNKTEYNKCRNSNNTNVSNASFLNRTTHEISVFKSIDNTKKNRIFVKTDEPSNPGKILKTMENLMSQISITDNKPIKSNINQRTLINKTQNEESLTKKPVKKQGRFLFEEIKYKEKKENIH